MSVRKPHTSEIRAAHPYLKKSWVPPPPGINTQYLNKSVNISLTSVSCQASFSSDLIACKSHLTNSKMKVSHDLDQNNAKFCILNTLVIKQTFYLQKVEAPKVTLGILFWILNKHSVQVPRKKNSGAIFYLFAFLENTCFVCNSMGYGSVEGAITSIMWHFTQKRILFFLFFCFDFCRKCHATFQEHN